MADQQNGKSLELSQQPLALEKRELASDVLASMARAQVQARYIVAQGRPRDWDVVRQRILKDCERPSFAETAWYRKPQGNSTVDGLSIRFAESAQRAMGNLMPERPVIYDDPTKRIIRVTMTDLESNVTHFKDLILEKTVERKKSAGRNVLDHRLNSYGEVVYIVEATEDELLTKESSISSKIERQLTLKILPGDIQDEAKRAIRDTLNKADKADPDAAKKRVIDAFDDMGVRVNDLKSFLGVESLDGLQPNDIKQLRGIWTAIKDGETNWREVMEARNEARGTKAGEKTAETTASGKSAEKVKEAAAKKAKGSQQQAPAQQQAEPEPQQSEPAQDQAPSDPPPNYPYPEEDKGLW